MKIVHIAPNCPYTDNWGYQENLLPKYQKTLGHDVAIITTNDAWENGKMTKVSCGEYDLADGVHVIRGSKKQYNFRIVSNLMSTLDIFEYLKQWSPDLIFFHGMVSATILQAVKYKKKVKPDCVIVQDNHLDYCIEAQYKGVKYYVIRAFYRCLKRCSIDSISKVYGVTPWRKQYAEEYYLVPKSKTDVLIMGADDENIDFANRSIIRRKKRLENNVSDTDFLIVTGGKIDEKKNIHLLMQACVNLKNVKLLVFGSVSPALKEEFEKLEKENANIIYIGWIDADRVYDYFFAADLVIFPGAHSVLWEQACASKVPCVFKSWDGMNHVNNGGNSDFIDKISPETIREKIQELHFTEKYFSMKKAAESEKTDIYLYSNIAIKSLECVNKNNGYN